MKNGYSALGIVVTGALVLAGVGPANAGESDTLDNIRSAVETRAVLPETATAGESIGLSDGLVSAPGSEGSDVKLRLPGAPRTAAQSDELALNVTGGDGYTTAIQDTGDGTFRALMHIESAAAPTEYRFELGEGVELIPLEDGGVTARDAAGDIMGTFEPAWALDANGAAVPTSTRSRAPPSYSPYGSPQQPPSPWWPTRSGSLRCWSWRGSPRTLRLRQLHEESARP